MIASSVALKHAVEAGRTIACIGEFAGSRHAARWVFMDTNECVSRGAIKTLLKRGELAVIQTDICGEPMQYGAPVI